MRYSIGMSIQFTKYYIDKERQADYFSLKNHFHAVDYFLTIRTISDTRANTINHEFRFYNKTKCYYTVDQKILLFWKGGRLVSYFAF